MGLCKKSHVGNVICSFCGFSLLSYKKNNDYFHTFFQNLKATSNSNGVTVGKPVKANSIIRILDSAGLIQIACGKCQHIIGEEHITSESDTSNTSYKYTFLEGSVKYIPWKF